MDILFRLIIQYLFSRKVFVQPVWLLPLVVHPSCAPGREGRAPHSRPILLHWPTPRPPPRPLAARGEWQRVPRRREGPLPDDVDEDLGVRELTDRRRRRRGAVEVEPEPPVAVRPRQVNRVLDDRVLPGLHRHESTPGPPTVPRPPPLARRADGDLSARFGGASTPATALGAGRAQAGAGTGRGARPLSGPGPPSSRSTRPAGRKGLLPRAEAGPCASARAPAPAPARPGRLARLWTSEHGRAPLHPSPRAKRTPARATASGSPMADGPGAGRDGCGARPVLPKGELRPSPTGRPSTRELSVRTRT